MYFKVCLHKTAAKVIGLFILSRFRHVVVNGRKLWDDDDDGCGMYITDIF